ncbi:MAG: hypothetical protein JO023_13410, partial [Chloroflexi bacterium]|nr:hypothetical protein [Chloroflexota bacterium]
MSFVFHERFSNILLGGGGLRQIAHALDDLLGRGVSLINPEGHLLARSASFPDERKLAWSAPVADPGEALGQVTLGCADGSYAAVMQPIQAGVDRLGAVVVLAESASLADDELMALERAAGVAALRLVQARALAEADQRFQAVCLDELMTGHVGRPGPAARARQRGRRIPPRRPL